VLRWGEQGDVKAPLPRNLSNAQRGEWLTLSMLDQSNSGICSSFTLWQTGDHSIGLLTWKPGVPVARMHGMHGRKEEMIALRGMAMRPRRGKKWATLWCS